MGIMPMPAVKAATAYAITANHLMTGDAVFYAHDKDWRQDIDKQTIFSREDQASQALEEIQKTQNHLIVGAYIIGLDGDDKPIAYRERLRLSGPTNYHHGKQEQGG